MRIDGFACMLAQGECAVLKEARRGTLTLDSLELDPFGSEN